MEHSLLTSREIEVILGNFNRLKIIFAKRGQMCKHLAFVCTGIIRVINDINEIESTVILL